MILWKIPLVLKELRNCSRKIISASTTKNNRHFHLHTKKQNISKTIDIWTNKLSFRYHRCSRTQSFYLFGCVCKDRSFLWPFCPTLILYYANGWKQARNKYPDKLFFYFTLWDSSFWSFMFQFKIMISKNLLLFLKWYWNFLIFLF